MLRNGDKNINKVDDLYHANRKLQGFAVVRILLYINDFVHHLNLPCAHGQKGIILEHINM